MYHRVMQGETLSSIASRYGVSIGGAYADHSMYLSEGQLIYVPTDTRYLRPMFGGGNRPTQGRPSSYAYTYSDIFSYSGLPAKTADQAALASADKHHGADWMKTAIGEIGVAEIAGMTRANPRILEYFKASKFWGKDDSSAKNAWCGSFAAWVMKNNGYTPVKNAFRAKEWKNFGKKTSKPLYGALGIKSRTGGGHVSFVMGKNKAGDKLFMLGGNQNDKVQVSEYPLNVWDKFVLPSDFDITKGSLPVYKKSAAASGKES